MVLEADPVFASARPDRFAAALERVPLVVSFATLPDDTALLADWILPEAHFLERWDLWTTPPGIPRPPREPGAPRSRRPLHDARPAAEIFLELARRTGLESAFPWKDVSAMVRAEMDGLYRARRGAVMGAPFDEAWVRMMEGAGWWAPGYRSADELWQRSQESGGWWDPFYDHGDWKRVLRHRVRALRVARRPAHRRGTRLARRGSRSPGHEESAPPRLARLLLFEPLPVAGGTGAELPFLQAILDPGHAEGWETWAENPPGDRRALGAQATGLGACPIPPEVITARARVTGMRVVPGAVALPVGLGKHGGGRWARGAGANPLRAALGPGRRCRSRACPTTSDLSVSVTA